MYLYQPSKTSLDTGDQQFLLTQLVKLFIFRIKDFLQLKRNYRLCFPTLLMLYLQNRQHMNTKFDCILLRLEWSQFLKSALTHSDQAILLNLSVETSRCSAFVSISGVKEDVQENKGHKHPLHHVAEQSGTTSLEEDQIPSIKGYSSALCSVTV